MADTDVSLSLPPAGGRRLAWTRVVARSLVLLWVSFWVYFGVASGIGERLPFWGIVMHTLMPGGLFALLALAAWRWPRVGGWILVVGAVAGFAFYYSRFVGFPPVSRAVNGATLTSPALLAGWLFIVAGRRVDGGGGAGSSWRAAAETLALALGCLLLVLSVLATFWMIGGAIWYQSPWGPGKADPMEWLALIAANLLVVGLLGVALFRLARSCWRGGQGRDGLAR